MAKLRLLLKRSGKAFTFVELLIAMVILAIVSGAVIMLAYTYFNHFEQANELSMARERGIMVVTYLEKRILNTGLGMPRSSATFEDGFRGLLNALNLSGYGGREWVEPIFLPEKKEGEKSEESEELMVAYAVPSGIYTIASADIGTDPARVPVSGSTLDNKVSNSDVSTKGWVVFPSVVPSPMPFRITDFSVSAGVTEEITLFAKQSNWFLPANSEMHLVRFLRAFVDGSEFKIDDMTINTGQPVVNGVLGCKFSFDDEDEKKVLHVSVLTRGDRRYSRYVSPKKISGWGTVENDDWRRYYLNAVRKGWRVRN